MRFLTMQRPMLAAAVSCIARPTVNNVAPLSAQLANVLALGRRHASVKAQGAYKKKSKRGIPKKLGAKRTGGEIGILPEQSNWLPEAIDCHHTDNEILTSSLQTNMSSPATFSTNNAAPTGGPVKTASWAAITPSTPWPRATSNTTAILPSTPTANTSASSSTRQTPYRTRNTPNVSAAST